MLWLLPILCAGPAWGAQQIRNIKVAISNPSSMARNSADIVIPIVEIRRVAPDFKPGAAIVTASDANTLEQDASVLQTKELPSQLDDLNGDGKADELAFQIDLAPLQTRVVTISWQPKPHWLCEQLQRTFAFSPNRRTRLNQTRGVSVIDPNAVDLWKRQSTLQLSMYASRLRYHDESPEIATSSKWRRVGIGQSRPW
jgi:hypothetical protein